MAHSTDNLVYPIGPFSSPESIDQKQINLWIQQIADFPAQLAQELLNLSEQDLKRKHRPEGWTIKQLVHHCADSHMNSFIRFKLALTEENPTIKPYEEHLWATLVDGQNADILSSLAILEGLHQRWAVLLRNLSPEDLDRTFVHPASQKTIDLKTNIGIYAWHGEHHLAHIKNAKELQLYE